MRLPLLAALTWAAATAALAAAPTPADDKALRDLGAAADAAWDAKDAARMAMQYSPDASLLVGGAGAEQQGRAAVADYYTRAFARRAGVMRHVSEIRGLQMLGTDLAVTDVFVRVEEKQPDGAWKLVRRFNNISLAAREADGWKLRVVRAYPIG